MKEQFVIEVRCSNCQNKELLASSQDKSKPAVFDTQEDALAHIDTLRRGLVSKSDNAGIIRKGFNYECPACRAFLPMEPLHMTIYPKSRL